MRNRRMGGEYLVILLLASLAVGMILAVVLG